MRKLILTAVLVIINYSLLVAQVAINPGGDPPHPSAGLDVNFTDKGLLLPRMTYEQRNDIVSPAEGLIIYCTDCNTDGHGALAIFQNGIWRVFDLNCSEPGRPSAGTRVPATNSMEWNWSEVPIALGYKFNTTNDYSTAIDLGSQTTYTESGLTCWTTYTRYVWAYNECGPSLELTLTGSTLEIPFSPAPSPAMIIPDFSSIIWDWTDVSGAIGYKFNTVNDPETALDLGNASTYFEEGLDCITSYTRYAWAYDDCGTSTALVMTQSTTAQFISPPGPGTHSATVSQIIWDWNPVNFATNYKWNTTNDFGSAEEMGSATSKTETGLSCNTSYTRYVWAYNDCGVSAPEVLTFSTLSQPPNAPAEATHVPSAYQVVWNWNSSAGATGYRWSSTNNYNTAQDLGNVLTKTEDALNCNTPYTRYIWAYSPCGVSAVTTITATTDLDPPAAPTAATHVALPTQITWNWNTVPGATSYKWNTVNNPATAISTGTNTTRVETGLTCNTGYTRYVWAVSNCGESQAGVLTQTTAMDPPPAPAEGTHVASTDQIVWNWTSVTGATGYKWNTTNDYNSAQDVGTATNRTETGLTCNTPYTRYVWAYNNCGVSAATELTESTSQAPPHAPTAATHVSTVTQITWNWNAAQGATGYKWNTTNDYGTAEDMFTATTKVENGLTCNTLYTRYVWAYSPCGVSNVTTLTFSTQQDPPDPPAAGVHNSTLPTQIVWNWSAVTGAAGYRWNTTNDVNTSIDLGNVLTRTENGLTCNTEYFRYVWSYDACGISATATELSHTTALDPPSPPSAGSHVASASQIIWNWNTVANATGYRWGTTTDYNAAEDMLTALSKTETGLSCNTPYTRYVWAYGPCGVSGPATLNSQTTLDPPAAPVAGTSVPGAYQVTWNWQAVPGATGYKWGVTDNYTGATDVGNVTSTIETSLSCNTGYTRYVWAYNGCDHSGSTVLTATTTLDPPPAPQATTHTPSLTQIIWNWGAVAGAINYKWNTTDDINTASDLGNVTSYTESGLTCNTPYTRYIWTISNCGTSTAAGVFNQSTAANTPATPTAGTHVASPTQIVWNWSAVGTATGYKWNTSNDYGTALDMGTNISYTETGLACNTPFTRYVWAYEPCGHSAPVTLTQSTTNGPPATPVAGTHVPSGTQIVWNWNVVSGASGYRWNTVDNYSTATDLGTATTTTENGLACNTQFTRYIWSYNACGNSTSVAISESTLNDAPAAPVAGTHVALETQITWNWNTVAGATGYKWNTTNDYGSALEMGTSTSHTETSLACGTSFTRYAWAYNSCGESTPVTLTKSTTSCWVCGQSFPVIHTAGLVAPVNKTVTYGTVNNLPGEPGKCWITRNLGASQQATSRSDATESSAGWYWQFNRKQGYKHDGTNRTPNSTWILDISENSDWAADNDPCLIELGTGWRVPTKTEWENVDNAGSWNNYTATYNSPLKLHAAGYLDASSGTLYLRGTFGNYWTSTQVSALTNYGNYLGISGGASGISTTVKAAGHTLRCIND